MTKQDDPIEILLKAAQVPQPSHDLADRIASAALQIEQKKPFWLLVKDIFAECHFPAPAYSLAAILLLGFAGGFMSYVGVDSEAVSIMSELYYDGGLL